MKALEATKPAFEAANSTLFMLLGGLSLFKKMRCAVEVDVSAGATNQELVAGRARGSTNERKPDAADPFTLAILGLLAAGQRLEERCGEVAADTADPAAPRSAQQREPRTGRLPRSASLRALLR